MTFEEKLLEMLSSPHTQVRLMALEQIKESNVTSETILKALEKSSHDTNLQVADKARQTLDALLRLQTSTAVNTASPQVMGSNENLVTSVSTPTPDPSPLWKLSDPLQAVGYGGQKILHNRAEDYSLLGQVLVLHPKTHAKFMSMIQFTSQGLILLWVLIFWFGIASAIGNILVPLFILGFILQFSPNLFWILPVTCDEPGCSGRVDKTRSQRNSFKADVYYQCQSCSKVYTTSIYSLRGRGGAHGGGH
jgi:hypothetical protein